MREVDELLSGIVKGDVIQVQIYLKSLGYYLHPIDNIRGKETNKAIIEFARAKGLGELGTEPAEFLKSPTYLTELVRAANKVRR